MIGFITRREHLPVLLALFTALLLGGLGLWFLRG